MHIINICNPDNRRSAGFIDAARERKISVTTLSWESLLAEMDFSQIGSKQTLRLDSCGEHFNVWKLIVLHGARLLQKSESCIQVIAGLQEDTGLWAFNKEWSCAWLDILERLADYAHNHHCTFFGNHPRSIATCFHKQLCRDMLESNNVPIPPGLAANSYSELNSVRKNLHWSQVFIKTYSNSSACGVAAIRWDRAGIPHAYTSIAGVNNGSQANWYTQLKINRYFGETAQELCTRLLKEGAVVERWLPKLGLGNKSCDIRWFVCHGHAEHAVVRGSKSPITNLHLGNTRVNLTDFKNLVGAHAWKLSRQTAIDACEALSIASAGVDVMLDINKRPWVLDVNAFGDLLPGIVADERNTWQEQVHQFS